MRARGRGQRAESRGQGTDGGGSPGGWLRLIGSPLVATARYVPILFPAFVVLALLGRDRRLRAVWLTLSVALLAVLLYTFLSGRFIA